MSRTLAAGAPIELKRGGRLVVEAPTFAAKPVKVAGDGRLVEAPPVATKVLLVTEVELPFAGKKFEVVVAGGGKLAEVPFPAKTFVVAAAACGTLVEGPSAATSRDVEFVEPITCTSVEIRGRLAGTER